MRAGQSELESGRLNSGYSYGEQVGTAGADRGVVDYLASRWRHSTKDEWAARVDRGEVLIDGSLAGASDRVKPGQRLVWNRPPWFEPAVPLHFALLHRDDDLVAVAKPSGLPTLPGGGFLEHTLLARVRGWFPEASPLHRLGRGTSGIVLFARRAESSAFLTARWHDEVRKVYVALAGGVIERDAFEVNVPIGPVPHRALGSIHGASREGKQSLSLVRVLERREQDTLVEVEIVTGRPHQIRVHLAAAGHPLRGDPLYPSGGVPAPSSTVLPGECGYLLHAERLVVPRPDGGGLELWCAPPPRLRSRS